ncbi:MAG: hypothetical protein M0C28_43085 [Candidatus Moduliflexus flocculans]|nr:hypothetical protein [Candidatus Moduliflexus flocculans]
MPKEPRKSVPRAGRLLEDQGRLPDARTCWTSRRSPTREFLQMELLPEERKDTGLQAALKDVFPISDFKETTRARVPQLFDRRPGSASAAGSRGSRTPGPSATPARRSCRRAWSSPRRRSARSAARPGRSSIPLCEHCGDRGRPQDQVHARWSASRRATPTPSP